MNKLDIFKKAKAEALKIGDIFDSMDRHTQLAYLFSRNRKRGLSVAVCEWLYDLAESLAE